MQRSQSLLWVTLATGIPMVMVSLDNLIVTIGLASIREDLGVGQDLLQWVVNAYALSFAGFLLAGAGLGDRFGRRRIFVGGIVLFTLASIACAMSESIGTLIAARALQGLGAAAILPLSLTLVVSSVPEERRNLAIGLWGGLNGLGIAMGPLVGGILTEALSWHWMFWINLPIGVLAVFLVLWVLRESTGGERTIDVLGTLLVTATVVIAVWAIVQAHEGWTQTVVLALGLSVVLLAAFLFWESRTSAPLIPLTMFRSREFVLSNVAAFAMYFGVFGSIFYFAQFMQGPVGFSPFQAGLATLPWTMAPMIVVPLASQLISRVGTGPLMAAGSALQAAGLGWIAYVAEPGVNYLVLVPALLAAGVGMGLMFAANPVAIMGAVKPHEQGKASGINNTVREFGGALGIAVLTTVFSSAFLGASATNDFDDAYIAGMQPALWVGVAVVVASAVCALFVRGGREPEPQEQEETGPRAKETIS
ncbi:MFS transporter [Nocardiopsis halotolerans]|uniref:MFS transporter n=1 Tax=Nocardiopsis halotolerans TaxID=124252 RepID=UPI000594DBE8|nr:MFS transporter [Nocardiopsis halotolerans]